MSVELSESILNNWAVLHDNARSNIEKSDECDRCLLNVIATSRRQREELNRLFGEFNLLPHIKSKLSEIQEQTKNIFNLFDFLQNEILHRLETQKKEEDFQKWRLSEVNNLRKYEISQKRKLHQYQTVRTKKYNEEFLRLEKLQNDVERLRQLHKLQREKEADEAAYKKKKDEERKRQEELKRKIEEQFLIERKRMEERKKLEKERLEKLMEERKRKAEERRKKKEEELSIRQLKMNMNMNTSPHKTIEDTKNEMSSLGDMKSILNEGGDNKTEKKEETEAERLQRMERENRLLKERLEILQKLKELEKKDDK